MVFLRNSAAQHEVTVAKYYLERGAYLAAANRAKYVVESFDRTPAMPEALTIMAKSYKIMGMNELAQDALTVLKQNFPNYEGIQKVEQLTLN
jgi:outer membrane protein assembly factor BamD